MRTHLICLLSALGVVAIYGLIATSDIDDLGLIEQAKQEQRDRIRTTAHTNAAYREFYKIEVEDDISSQIFAQR